jgi:hypothetical protein
MHANHIHKGLAAHSSKKTSASICVNLRLFSLALIRVDSCPFAVALTDLIPDTCHSDYSGSHDPEQK